MEEIEHHPAYLNWKEYQAGKLTYEEMLSRNNKLCISTEIKSVIIEKTKDIFNPKPERGCPDDDRWES